MGEGIRLWLIAIVPQSLFQFFSGCFHFIWDDMPGLAFRLHCRSALFSIISSQKHLLVDYNQLLKRVRFSLELVHFVLHWQHCFRVYSFWAVAYECCSLSSASQAMCSFRKLGWTTWLVHQLEFCSLWVCHPASCYALLRRSWLNLVVSVFDA